MKNKNTIYKCNSTKLTENTNKLRRKASEIHNNWVLKLTEKQKNWKPDTHFR